MIEKGVASLLQFNIPHEGVCHEFEISATSLKLRHVGEENPPEVVWRLARQLAVVNRRYVDKQRAERTLQRSLQPLTM